MKQAIHLLDPVEGLKFGADDPVMRCGRRQNLNSVKPVYTVNPDEVTCSDCRSYINNPWRILRKYGKVKVVESFYAILWADNGYHFDLVAIIDQPGWWQVIVSEKQQVHLFRTLAATNMSDLGFLLVKLIENEIKKQSGNEVSDK